MKALLWKGMTSDKFHPRSARSWNEIIWLLEAFAIQLFISAHTAYESQP
jgi:hypothetical protein